MNPGSRDDSWLWESDAFLKQENQRLGMGGSALPASFAPARKVPGGSGRYGVGEGRCGGMDRALP